MHVAVEGDVQQLLVQRKERRERGVHEDGGMGQGTRAKGTFKAP